MMRRLEAKRAELDEEIAIMEIDLERAKMKRDLLDEIITEEYDLLGEECVCAEDTEEIIEEAEENDVNEAYAETL